MYILLGGACTLSKKTTLLRRQAQNHTKPSLLSKTKSHTFMNFKNAHKGHTVKY